MFAELERKVAEKKAAGIDVISLGIGDPDTPTYPHIVEALKNAVEDPGTHHYPSNRGRAEFREALARFYDRRFGVDDRPGDRGHPRDRRQGVHLQPLLRLPRSRATSPWHPTRDIPSTRAAQSWPAPRRSCCPLDPELGFVPDLDAIDPMALSKARLMFLNYPNNPTGAVAPDGFFERVVELANRHEFLVVHDNAYSETTYDGYVAPSFLATPGAKEVGVEVFSLSKGFNMTGWRCAAILGNADAIQTYWRLKTNVDSGLFEAVQLAGAAALDAPSDSIDAMNAIYERRRDLVVSALRDIGVDVGGAEGHDLRVGPGPRGAHLDLVRRAGAGGGGRDHLARFDVRPLRRRLLPHLPDDARRAHHRSRRADARAPLGLRSAIGPARAHLLGGRARGALRIRPGRRRRGPHHRLGNRADLARWRL